MADMQESDGRQRSRGNTGPTGTGRTVIKGESPILADSGRHASEDAIKAVSGLLSAKKTAFNRPSNSAQITLPDVSGSMGDIARRLKTPPSPRANFDLPRTSLDAPPVKLPDGGPVDGPRSDGLSPGEVSRIEPSGGAHSSPIVGANGISTPAVRDVSPPISAAAKPSESIQGVHPSWGGDNPRRRESGVADGIASQLDSIRVGPLEPPVDRSSSSASSRAVAVDLPREPGGASTATDSRHPVEAPGLGSRHSGSGETADLPHNSARHADSSMSFIRNPLSADLRNFSMASPVLPERNGGPSDHGGMGISSNQNAFGAAATQQGGSSIDLSKTNELLQQLVDAVRKQRASSLPVGGPSFYPDR